MAKASAPGTWLAALCAREGLALVLGHALKASHGGKANNDTIDAPKIAVWLRGGRLPHASVYPADRRPTRDLLRRRLSLVRQRAERLTHVQQTTSQDHRPALSKNIASKANREGVAERFPEPAGQKRIAVDLTLIAPYDHLRRDLALAIVQTAKPHAPQTLSRLQGVPGIGTMLRLVLLDALPPIDRFPRVHAVVSYGRLVTWAQASAGQRDGPSGTKRGNASLQGACSEAAVLLLRRNPAGQRDFARLEKEPGTGQALTVLAHPWARALYDMLRRETVCARRTFLHGPWSGGGGPVASLDHHGPSLHTGSARLASSNAEEHRGACARTLGL